MAAQQQSNIGRRIEVFKPPTTINPDSLRELLSLTPQQMRIFGEKINAAEPGIFVAPRRDESAFYEELFGLVGTARTLRRVETALGSIKRGAKASQLEIYAAVIDRACRAASDGLGYDTRVPLRGDQNPSLFLRDKLFDLNEWDLLAELLWIEANLGIEPADAVARYQGSKPLSDRLDLSDEFQTYFDRMQRAIENGEMLQPYVDGDAQEQWIVATNALADVAHDLKQAVPDSLGDLPSVLTRLRIVVGQIEEHAASLRNWRKVALVNGEATLVPAADLIATRPEVKASAEKAIAAITSAKDEEAAIAIVTLLREELPKLSALHAAVVAAEQASDAAIAQRNPREIALRAGEWDAAASALTSAGAAFAARIDAAAAESAPPSEAKPSIEVTATPAQEEDAMPLADLPTPSFEVLPTVETATIGFPDAISPSSAADANPIPLSDPLQAADSSDEGSAQPLVGEEAAPSTQSPHADGPPPEREATVAAVDAHPGPVATTAVEEDGKPALEEIEALPRDDTHRSYDDVAAGLLEQDRCGLAWHLSRCRVGTSEGLGVVVTQAIARALLLAPFINGPGGPAANAFGEVAGDLLVQGEEADGEAGWQIARRLLLFAACLRPALLAPGTGATECLDAVATGTALKELHPLKAAILDFRRVGFVLNASNLKGVIEQNAWREALDVSVAAALHWMERAPSEKRVFAPATVVWRAWSEPSGPFGKAMATIVSTVADVDRAATAAHGLREFVMTWSNGDYVEKQMHVIDFRNRPSASRKPIEGRAVRDMRSKVDEAIDLIRRWIDVVEARPQGETAASRNLERFRTASVAAAGRARQALAELGTDDDRTRAAAAVALRAIDSIERLLDPAIAEPRLPPLRHAASRELLRIPEFSLDREWMPRGDDRYRIARQIAELAAEPCWSAAVAEAAFARAIEHEQHLATGRIIEALGASGDVTAETIERLERDRKTAIGRARERLAATLRRTKSKLDQSAMLSVVAEPDRLDWEGRFAHIDPRALPRDPSEPGEAVGDFPEAHHSLAEIDNAIDTAREARRHELTERVASVPERPERAADRETVLALIARDELATASEFVDLFVQGEALMRPEPRNRAFDDFFPDFVDAACAELERRAREGGADLADELRSGGCIGPLEMAAVEPERCAEAADMLTAWNAAKLRRGDVAVSLRTVFERLGFVVQKVRAASGDAARAQYRRFDMETVPLGSRDSCPVPSFGSSAHGRYALVAFWDRVSEAVVVETMSTLAATVPAIAVVFGRMGVDQRRALVQRVRDRRTAPFVLLDEALLLFLSPFGYRLPIFFQCTLPFTLCTPYQTGPAPIPTETFYGRNRERQLIMDPQGTHLLYGGRQMGKSALLRDVADREHRPHEGVIVAYFDMLRPPFKIEVAGDGIWRLISSVLVGHGISRSAVRPDTIRKAVGDWIAASPNRRMVVLIDEADEFVLADGKAGYPNLKQLQGLMADTAGKFKVVFAGLHNVQRTARDPNSPIAHLAQPVCIGPLLDRDERREALNLVRTPIEALGYRFENEELPLRILSLTNYYPNLIQYFLYVLNNHLNAAAFDAASSPPYTITEQHIETVYESNALADIIQQRFKATLDLDSRYRFITLLIAHHTIEAQSRVGSAFDVGWIREQSLQSWPAGFSDSRKIDDFIALCEEMEGLGVLRRFEGRYALRSPNVLTLLGTPDSIEQALIDAMDAEPPIEFEARHRHAPRGDNTFLRSPLSVGQANIVLSPENEVVVLFGTEISDIDAVPEALKSNLPADGSLRMAEKPSGLAQFERFLAQPESAVSGRFVAVVVPRTVPWMVEWVAAARRFSSALRHRGERRSLKVVFIGDAGAAWRWTQVEAAHGVPAATVLALGPWSDKSVRLWLQDAGFGPKDKPEDRALFGKLAGNWTALLNNVGDLCRTRPGRWRQALQEVRAAELGRPDILHRLGIVPEAEPLLRALATMGALKLGELADLTEASQETVKSFAAWAELMGLVRRDGDSLEIEPFAQSALAVS